MKRLNETPWTPTERTKNGKYAVMRMAAGGDGKTKTEYYNAADEPFIFVNRETAQRLADDLNGNGKEESRCRK